MKPLNIVFPVSEATPLAKTGGLADVAGSLPKALTALGHRCTIIMPWYGPQMAAAGVGANEMMAAMSFWIDGLHQPVSFWRAEIGGVTFVLIRNDALFDRPWLYGPPGGAYYDNLLRYGLFCRAALEACSAIGGPVDILHCHDWQSGLIPLLLNRQYRHKPALASTRTMLTIHNLAYQGIFPAEWIAPLALPAEDFHPGGYEFYGQINCLKAGIMAADHLTTVSPTYAQEILTPEFGCQLDGFLRNFRGKLSGIVNGLDLEEWNPESDKALPSNFSATDRKGRAHCKSALQHELGFVVDEQRLLLTAITRLTDQKGIDLLLGALPTLLAAGYQVALLGSGDPHYEGELFRLADQFPGQMAFCTGFRDDLARRFYAGADLFLMPSRFEPCGLSQLIAMRYGCVPVVRATGGLKDTVSNYRTSAKTATGFAFDEASVEALLAAVGEAADLYSRPAAWKLLQGRALRHDCSWTSSAGRYVEIYNSLTASGWGLGG